MKSLERIYETLISTSKASSNNNYVGKVDVDAGNFTCRFFYGAQEGTRNLMRFSKEFATAILQTVRSDTNAVRRPADPETPVFLIYNASLGVPRVLEIRRLLICFW